MFLVLKILFLRAVSLQNAQKELVYTLNLIGVLFLTLYYSKNMEYVPLGCWLLEDTDMDDILHLPEEHLHFTNWAFRDDGLASL